MRQRFLEKKTKTNHSLRVTGASSLFDAGVPEKIIQQSTGHRSIDGLRVYERVTEEQNAAVSKILTSKDVSSFAIKMKEPSAQLSKASFNDQSCPGSFDPQYNNCQVNIYNGPLPSYCPTAFWPPFAPSCCNYSIDPLKEKDLNEH